MDHAVMRPKTGLAIANEALICVDAHQQKSVDKKGCNLLDLHRSSLQGRRWKAGSPSVIQRNPVEMAAGGLE